jgi:predicted DNA-binding protein YlxM (UPF0122 family)
MGDKVLPSEFYGDETPMWRRGPENPLQALMESMPNTGPEESVIELEPVREAVAEAVDMLTEEEQWVINALYSEQLSMSKVGKQLNVSKTHVFRIRNRALLKLQSLLQSHPTIRRRIQMADTWNEAASQWVTDMSSAATYSDTMDLAHVTNMRDLLLENGRWLERTSIWQSIAYEAISELRWRELWDSGQMLSLLCSKQHDYGHGNILKGGLFGVAIRLSDKIERYDNLTKKVSTSVDTQGPRNESLIDTLTDMVGYCVVACMLIEGTFTLELAS